MSRCEKCGRKVVDGKDRIFKREHDRIVENLRHQLEAKGIDLLPFHESEGMIAEFGHYPDKPKVAHIAFKPDIVMSDSARTEDRFFLEYV
jgi:hypothetical protein